MVISWLSKATHSAIKTFNSNCVESGNGILQNYSRHNVKINSNITLTTLSIPKQVESGNGIL